MILEEGKYYHLYNRSNNHEKVFKCDQNYLYFLDKVGNYLIPFVEIIAYCLMPTHFHFLIKVIKNEDMRIQKSIGLLLSSYTKAINKQHKRQGALFQPHSKAKEIVDERYLLTVISYIHQNPVRLKHAKHMKDWLYSSYQEILGKQGRSLVHQDFYSQYFQTTKEFVKYSEEVFEKIIKEHWI